MKDTKKQSKLKSDLKKGTIFFMNIRRNIADIIISDTMFANKTVLSLNGLKEIR